MERYPNLRVHRSGERALGCSVGGGRQATQGPDYPLPSPPVAPVDPRRQDPTFFVDPWPWLDVHARRRTSVRQADPRQHHGAARRTPRAMCFAHDSRTLELARYFQIPHREMADMAPDTDAADSLRRGGLRPDDRRPRRARSRRSSTTSSATGCTHIFEPGEDPATFDAQVAAVDFPPPVRRRRFLAFHRAVRAASGGSTATRQARRRPSVALTVSDSHAGGVRVRARTA